MTVQSIFSAIACLYSLPDIICRKTSAGRHLQEDEVTQHGDAISTQRHLQAGGRVADTASAFTGAFYVCGFLPLGQASIPCKKLFFL
jgi:hypothetical protein